MKTRKFTKVISFILSIALIFSTVAIKASAYSTVTTTYDCPKTLCFSDLVISGPYGDPNETVDSGVPYLGGMTYLNVYQNHFNSTSDNYNNYHMYLVYCPKYDNSDSSLLRHTMTLMFAKHGYTTMSYTQFNLSYHYANKVCDHGTDFKGSNVYALTQELCGENAYLDDDTMVSIADEYQSQTGCGKETAVLENHNWSYGSWYKNGDNYHSRTKTCVDCGYSVVVSDVHSLTEGSWENSSSTQHKRTTTCSTCDYSKTTYADHQFTYGAWENSSSSEHKRTATCSDCGYSKTEYASHNLTESGGIYYGDDSDENYDTYPGDEYHRYDATCSDCDYASSRYESHDMYVKVDWYDYDTTYHKKLTQCYHCEFGVSYYTSHKYPTNLYTYKSVDDTSHQITKHCDTCTRTVDGGTESHNYVAGEWTEIAESDPNASIYDCNTYHKRTLTCSDCGHTKDEYSEHNMLFEDYASLNDDRHECTPKCSDCTYEYNLNEPHSFNEEDYSYEVIDKDFHLFIKPCEKCDYAYEVGEYHEDADSDCYCDDCGYLLTKFSVTLPTTMNFVMSKTGEVYSADNVQILNNSTAAVSVKQVNLETLNGWSLTAYDETAIASAKVDLKIIGLKLNTAETATAGTTDSFILDDWIIEKDASLPIPYDAVVSATSTPIENEQVMNVVFIVDWKE